MSEKLLLYHVALTLIPQIGDIQIGILLKHFVTPDRIFKASKKELESLPGIGAIRASQIKNFQNFETAEKELEFLLKNNVRVLVKGHEEYPSRLEQCIDAPYVLFYKGSVNLNAEKVISIVGTRSPTAYGKDRVTELLSSLASQSVIIVSGLAYGIDTIAHKESLKNGLPTVAVLGHGFNYIYPYANKEMAAEMINHGGLLTEFMHQVKPDKQNFPKRNRIVAGISDAIVVIESGEKGGSLITADIGNSYNKDVLAYPGRALDKQSIGCNQLIGGNKANLITSGRELIEFLNWEPVKVSRNVIQPELFLVLDENEKIIYELISGCQPISIDEITARVSMNPSKTATIILSLEMKDLIISFPGKLYKTACR